MKTNTDLRREGRETLDGKWGTFVAVTLIETIIFGIIQLPSNLSDILSPFCHISVTTTGMLNSTSVVLLLIALPLLWGTSVLYLRNRRNEPADIEHMFDGFKDFGRIFTTLLLLQVYVLLWTLLLIVPGIVKSLSYAMTPYILYDHPELSRNAAIERSMAMMQGYKAKLLLLSLSFIGWGILCIFTCGIGMLWLAPYIKSSTAAFYEDVRSDYEQRLAAKQV